MREMTEARPDAAAAAPPLAMRILRALAESREITLLLLVILLALAMSLVYPANFPTAANLRAVLLNLAPVGILVCGMMLLMIGGTSNLTRFGHDFPLMIWPVLEALEEQVVLLKLLGEAKDSGMTVRIGHENAHEGLNSTSVVAVGYGSGDEAVAKLGVVGPTRMDYPGTMGAVRAVARYVGQILAES